MQNSFSTKKREAISNNTTTGKAQKDTEVKIMIKVRELREPIASIQTNYMKRTNSMHTSLKAKKTRKILSNQRKHQELPQNLELLCSKRNEHNKDKQLKNKSSPPRGSKEDSREIEHDINIKS
ncbi:hypothetical protein PIB30_037939 [Stylosanthes scabra]|uniref:Uncharacterized protein n=1 Tax=Stylosanthes scabra TaxID=79078 RepID=A0ABU6UGL8_9FABA|nr:hypothetical protein [Stylosanthes scabra]